MSGTSRDGLDAVLDDEEFRLIGARMTPDPDSISEPPMHSRVLVQPANVPAVTGARERIHHGGVYSGHEDNG